jgi:hypothetical protein
MPKFRNPTTDRIAVFLKDIGLPICAGPVPDRTILPGIHVDHGTLIVDEDKLAYPGDLLHEAGHLAVVPAALRATLQGDTGDEPGQEMAAIAWSWAAVLHLELPPEVVFHPAGYRGGSASIIENFRDRRYFGVPYLKWIGLTGDDFPAMVRWCLD